MKEYTDSERIEAIFKWFDLKTVQCGPIPNRKILCLADLDTLIEEQERYEEEDEQA